MATIYGRVPPPEMQLELLNRQETQQVIGDEDVAKAISTLQKYKDGKANLEERVIQDEQWWKLRHWEVIRGKKQNNFDSPQPSSAWLFNTVLNKHADAMDNYPEPAALPREKSDKDSATMLSSVLPVVMEYNEFEEVYSDGGWEKLKHGTAVYGVFWDKTKENGLGDIAIRGIDLLKIFWEPGITDIQKSRNLFIVDLIDEDILNDQYPEYKGKLLFKSHSNTAAPAAKVYYFRCFQHFSAADIKYLLHKSLRIGAWDKNPLTYLEIAAPEFPLSEKILQRIALRASFSE